MNTALSQDRLEALLDQAVQEVTELSTGVCLHQDDPVPGGDLCTISISFQKGFHTTLTFCADTALLLRMTQNAFYTDAVTFRDMEDFSKEYFNVLCGRIAALLYETTRTAARFSVPAFYRGQYDPQAHQIQFALNYTDGQQHSAQLIHHIPCPGKDAS